MQLEHADSDLSTAPESDSERANAVRLSTARGGHVESHFLKANSPDGQRALWIKHTLLVPSGRPDAAVAEVWAIAFAERGRRKCAHKQSFPLAAATLSAAPFAIRTPAAQLAHGRAAGALGEGADRLAWDLRYACPAQAFRPFPLARMYEGRFPRTKSLTPAPDSAFEGWFEAFGERWDLADFRGAQGHNWGASHAHAYAWVHANVWRRERDGAPAEGVWLEALSGRVRLGPLVTPWLSVAAVCFENTLLRFDRPRALLARTLDVSRTRYAFTLKQGDARLAATFTAEPAQLAGLRYEDPDGAALACLNSKLASGRMQLSFRGRTEILHTDQAALELGTRATDHGIPMLA